MKSIRYFLNIAMVVVLGIGIFIGCSDSTSPETGAAVLVSFRPTFEDVLQPGKSLSLPSDFPPSAEIESALILDSCGQQIRDMCDGDCSGFWTLMWNGLDDEGLRAETPSGGQAKAIRPWILSSLSKAFTRPSSGGRSSLGRHQT